MITVISDKPMVSVIIPTYNRAHFIDRAIQSILNQTYQNFEIIVVDDASSDNTEEVIETLKNEKIRYIRHEFNKGATAARNTGIKAAQGEYIGLLDDDDEWLVDKLEKQVMKFLDSPSNTGLIYSGFYFVSERTDAIISEVNPDFNGNVYTNLLKGCICGSPTPLIKEDCFQKSGLFDEALPSCQDWDMWIRISKYFDFDFVPEILAKHRVHGNQISVNLDKKISARQTLLKKYESDLRNHPLILSNNLKRLGILFCLNGNVSEGRKYLRKSIKQYSYRKSTYVHLALSYLAPSIHKKILMKYSVTNVDGIIFYY